MTKAFSRTAGKGRSSQRDSVSLPGIMQPSDAERWAMLGEDYGITLRFLGSNSGVFYFYSSIADEIVSLKSAELRWPQIGLLVDHEEWWERSFYKEGRDGTAVDWTAAQGWLMRNSNAIKGGFSRDRVRGRGVHLEKNGDVVVHLGSELAVNGEVRSIAEYVSPTNVYTRRPAPSDLSIPAFENPLTNEEGRQLVDICSRLRWNTTAANKGAMGQLFAGFLGSAMVCGAMPWHAHAWATGRSGWGKTWVMTNIARPLLAGKSLVVQGSSTEAGIRHELLIDALPVIFDEAEGEDAKSEARLKGVFDLTRQATSDDAPPILKGQQTPGQGGLKYTMRSSFLLISILVSLKAGADKNRWIIFDLDGADEGPAEEARERFSRLKQETAALITEENSRRMYARMIREIPAMKRNAAIFKSAAAEVLGSERRGDVYSFALAGWWALVQGGDVTLDQAVAAVTSAASAMADAMLDPGDTDEQKLRNLVLAHQLDVRTRGGESRNYEKVSVAHLLPYVVRHANDTGRTYGVAEAKAALSTVGIKVWEGDDAEPRGVMFLSAHPGFSSILQGSALASASPAMLLQRLSRAGRKFGRSHRVGGVPGKPVVLPLADVLACDPAVAERMWPEDQGASAAAPAGASDDRSTPF